MTVNPYGGGDSILPFAEHEDRGVLVWCRSSNPGAAELQDMRLEDGRAVYEAVAERAREWNINGNVGLVIGATWPHQVQRVRDICPDMLLLLPGIGSQEGELEASVQAAMDAAGAGFIVAASRSILYAGQGDGFARGSRKAAQRLRTSINRTREAVLTRR
jgi:orotidine-5'-phosphate decarboxylase